jgi:SAM-dependent methyltransferase
MSVRNNDIGILTGEETGSRRFQDLYLALRGLEKRMYPDEVLLHLPEPGPGAHHQEEWRIRKASCRRLVAYLQRKQRPLKILEAGCGNGWLSNRLSGLRTAQVTGLDINLPELEQASRVFAHKQNLRFVHGDLWSGIPQGERFDVIVFAASLQYFRSLPAVIDQAIELLSNKGEIHIIDTHFYPEKALELARQRSAAYFLSMGFAEMKRFYFHHSFSELEAYHYRILFDPRNIFNRVFHKNQFHWIRVKPFA